LQVGHAPRHFFQLPQEGLHAARSQAQFLDERERLVTSGKKALSGGDPVLARNLAADYRAEIATIFLQQVAQRRRPSGMRAMICSLVSRSVSET
jgi:hypothetical protein